MRVFILFSFVILLMSCAATNNHSTQSWRGLNANILLKKFGTPNVTNTAPNGNKTWVYTTQTDQNYPSSPSFGVPTVVHAGALPIVVSGPPAPLNQNLQFTQCVRTFEIDKQNIIVSERKQGAC